MGKSKNQKQQKSDKKAQQYLKKKGYKDKVIVTKKSEPHKKTPKAPTQNTSSSSEKGSKGLSNLQQSFQKKLEGARFRVINERLYTCPGSEAFEEFQKNKSLFNTVSESNLLFFLSI
jgi:hypothetical protein